MKTRIVNPTVWLNEDFAKAPLAVKLLFCYLVNNPQLGLTRYAYIPDRQILFDTGISKRDLEAGKRFFTSIGWIFFKDGWVYHNHDFAYVDYFGRDRVMAAKEEELESIPTYIKQHFAEQLEKFKGLVRGYEGVSNPFKTINHKSEIINHNTNKGEKEIVKRKGGKKYSSLKDLTEKDFLEIAEKYDVSVKFVRVIFDRMENWIYAKGRRYKNYKRALMNWVSSSKERLLEGEMDLEERKRAVKKLAEIKEQLGSILARKKNVN